MGKSGTVMSVSNNGSRPRARHCRADAVSLRGSLSPIVRGFGSPVARSAIGLRNSRGTSARFGPLQSLWGSGLGSSGTPIEPVTDPCSQIGTGVRMRSYIGAWRPLSPGFPPCIGATLETALHRRAILAARSIRDPLHSVRHPLWQASSLGVIPAPNGWRGRGRLRGA